MIPLKDKHCAFCGSLEYKSVFTYRSPPPLETVFKSIDTTGYFRQIVQCSVCLHMESVHEMKLGALYEGEYNASTYTDREGMQRTFQKIISLPSGKSDNYGRCENIKSFISERKPSVPFKDIRVLDIGSGLGVFPWQMKQFGFSVHALDPDTASVGHIKDEIQIPCYSGDFFEISIAESFDLICLNKVLEHVRDPIKMLARTASILRPGGYVYIELPDAECAFRDGAQREEFVIDHIHVFSGNSLFLLASRAGFLVETFERLQEPSTKYTLRAFLKYTG